MRAECEAELGTACTEVQRGQRLWNILDSRGSVETAEG